MGALKTKSSSHKERKIIVYVEHEKSNFLHTRFNECKTTLAGRKQKSYFFHYVTYFFNELAIAKNKYLITVDYCRQSKDVKVTMEVQLAVILGYYDTERPTDRRDHRKVSLPTSKVDTRKAFPAN